MINHIMMALESGRKRGLMKSRYAALIEAIELDVQQAGQYVLSPAQWIEQGKDKTKAVKSDCK